MKNPLSQMILTDEGTYLLPLVHKTKKGSVQRNANQAVSSSQKTRFFLPAIASQRQKLKQPLFAEPSTSFSPR